jgi:hypothetical protein
MIGKPEWKRSRRRPRRRWEDNIGMDIYGNRVGRYGLDASSSGQ